MLAIKNCFKKSLVLIIHISFKKLGQLRKRKGKSANMLAGRQRAGGLFIALVLVDWNRACEQGLLSTPSQNYLVRI